MLTKKKIVILSVAIFALIMSLTALLLLPTKTSQQTEISSSASRPSATPEYGTNENKAITATPILPTILLQGATLIPTIVASPSATPEVTLGRLSFIQGQDIYNTDLKTTQLLVKNDSTPSGNLKWSPKGSYLSWTEKSREGTQSAVVIYSVDTKKTKIIPLEIASIEEYFYSPDEKQISVMYGENPNQIASVDINTSTFVPESFFASPYPVSFITWLKNGETLFGGKNGIFLYSLPDKTWTPITDQQGIDHIALSPDESKILYSVKSSEDNNWYIHDLTATSSSVLIKPQSSDFTPVDLPTTAMEKGFDSKAVWFPSSDKILLSVKHLREFPIVGVYDITSNSFRAISFFNIKNSDFMSDPYTLVGEREVSKNGRMESQIQLFSIEGAAKLGLIKVIPNSSSPAFYSGQ